ncbi:RCOR3-like protein [Mya arenaria]|uniref:RCOR3-like protein n=1 Tax=Mya arenaria TaxID=6604 RepID=A0ABY7F9Y7_MYAAR|nr:RCOR3-like protein [Mya arenaria]
MARPPAATLPTRHPKCCPKWPGLRHSLPTRHPKYCPFLLGIRNTTQNGPDSDVPAYPLALFGSKFTTGDGSRSQCGRKYCLKPDSKLAMVMADRYVADIRNGRRYRGASPTNGFSEDSSDEEERGGGGMRVGNDYQVKVPAFDPVDEYLTISKEKHGYNMEQALGMLFWHKHNVEKALADLPNFTPFPDEWTVEDKVLFEQAFSFHGKSFHRIRQMLPDKSIAALVKYYYSWKKTRSRTSLMDRQAKKFNAKGEGDKIDEESENGSKNNSDTEEVKEENKDETTCSNCGVTSSQLNPTPKGSLCSSCYQYWRRTGVMRSMGAKRHEPGQHRHNPMKHRRKPPRGMYLQAEDLKSMVTGPQGQAEALLKNLDSELVAAKRSVQNNKQMLGMQKHKLGSSTEMFRCADNMAKINAKWTNEELLLAVQGIRKYGKDFAAIAEVIGTKTEAHLRSFFVNFRRRYNLDEMEVDSKEEPVKAPSPSPAPPPLVKQPAEPSPAAVAARRGAGNAQKTILQQPPPLIKPASNTSASNNTGITTLSAS